MLTKIKGTGNRGQGEPNKKNGEGLPKGEEESGETPKKEKDLSKIKCYNCGEKGHISPNCPKKLKAATEDANIKTAWKAKTMKKSKQQCTVPLVKGKKNLYAK